MVAKLFEELAYRDTPLGPLSLRRRHILQLGRDVLEIKLGEEHLMSDLFTQSEIALARLALADVLTNPIDVVVGGLGLGYTAQAVLEHAGTGHLIVVEALPAVIDWHENGLLPLGAQMVEDDRCRFVLGDFFSMSNSIDGFDPDAANRKFDAVLVDIDHAPDRLLARGNASFYSPDGLARLRSHLKPGGVFALWSDDLPADEFTDRLATVFVSARAETVTFDNPLQDSTFTQTIYIAHA